MLSFLWLSFLLFVSVALFTPSSLNTNKSNNHPFHGAGFQNLFFLNFHAGYCILIPKCDLVRIK